MPASIPRHEHDWGCRLELTRGDNGNRLSPAPAETRRACGRTRFQERRQVALTLLALLLTASTEAQDRVELQRKGLSGRFVVSGLIEEYTGTQIRVRSVQDGSVREYPAAEVVHVETSYTQPHLQAQKLLGEGRAEAAVAELEAALKKETRAWVRREIIALAVRAALRMGDYSVAAGRYLALLKSDPTTRHFVLVPLVWAPEPLSAQTRNDATGWLTAAGDPARLIGASLLLDDAREGGAANAALRELSVSSDDRIRQLARMQIWRREIAAGELTASQIARLQQQIDELPAELRAGPMYLLGRAAAVRRDYELAAASLLWPPLCDDHDSRLAGRATLEASLALIKIGQRAEAEGLLVEVQQRFAETPLAGEAARLLKLLRRGDGAASQPTDG